MRKADKAFVLFKPAKNRFGGRPAVIHIISKGGLPLIEFRNVSKVYNNGTEALHNINLKVDKGEFVFIVGSSGAGKSTFLKLITCEERPNEGQVIIDGLLTSARARPTRCRSPPDISVG